MSIFSNIPLPKLKRSTFNLSHDVKLTGNIGKLIPVLCQPVIPGDKWKISTQFLLRLNPLLAPVMHQMSVYFHAFFVPNRLVWEAWEEFITRGVNGDVKPELPYTTPKEIFVFLRQNFLGGNSVKGSDCVCSLPDYMGLPVENLSLSDTGTKISLLPFKGYQLIYDEYYRDETLEPEVEIYKDLDGFHEYVNTGDNKGEPLASLLTLRNRAWKKDYFTGALPWPQRLADAEVTLPLVGNAPLKKVSDFSFSNGSEVLSQYGGSSLSIEIDGSGFLKAKNGTGSLRDAGIDLNNLLTSAQISKLQADLSAGNSVTINQLREAVRLQMWLENNARGGSRYTEQLLAHFGVRSKDSRLQRPEYLGGFSAPVNISEVLQTSQTNDDTGDVLGKQGGHGFALNGGRTIKRYFDEHGYLFIILSVRPQPSYFQGIPKDFTKMDNLDFYFPEFQHLGEQPVLNRELYYKGNSQEDEATFGYVPRYAEYKYCPNRICGRFRTDMLYYHMARKFSDVPKLNSDFIICDESMDGLDRIFAAQVDPATEKEYDHLWFDVAHNIKCSRKMSRYGIPKLL